MDGRPTTRKFQALDVLLTVLMNLISSKK